MSHSGSIWRQFDFVLVGVALVLTIFGVLMIRSATLNAVDPDLINRVPDQIRFALLGIPVLFGLAAVDYRLLGGLHQWLYLLMIALLILVTFFGVQGDAGAGRWINIGIRIQPSEIAKVVIIITLGHFLASNYQKLNKLSTVVKSLLHVGVPMALIFIQPNLGMTILFGITWLVMIWAAGLRFKHIAIAVLVLSISLPLTIPVAWAHMQDYQKQRITSF